MSLIIDGSQAIELDRRRKAMKHADDLGIDVAAVINLICPPACETCKGSGKKPRPEGWDQQAHLDTGTCHCHDSWDQCPCEHRVPECGCCPGGTGLCGPLPCPECHGRSRHTLHDRVDEVRLLAIDLFGELVDGQTLIAALEAILADVAKVTP